MKTTFLSQHCSLFCVYVTVVVFNKSCFTSAFAIKFGLSLTNLVLYTASARKLNKLMLNRCVCLSYHMAFL